LVVFGRRLTAWRRPDRAAFVPATLYTPGPRERTPLPAGNRDTQRCKDGPILIAKTSRRALGAHSRIRAPMVGPIGLVLLFAGLFLFWLLHHLVSDRVANGLPAQAIVTNVAHIQIGRQGDALQRITVSYHVDGNAHTAALMALLDSGTHTRGQSLDVYVSRSNFKKVATRDGYASEGWLMQLPWLLTSIGGVMTISQAICCQRVTRAGRNYPKSIP
jgi:hypothetical protein